MAVLAPLLRASVVNRDSMPALLQLVAVQPAARADCKDERKVPDMLAGPHPCDRKAGYLMLPTPPPL